MGKKFSDAPSIFCACQKVVVWGACWTREAAAHSIADRRSWREMARVEESESESDARNGTHAQSWISDNGTLRDVLATNDDNGEAVSPWCAWCGDPKETAKPELCVKAGTYRWNTYMPICSMHLKMEQDKDGGARLTEWLKDDSIATSLRPPSAHRKS